MSTPETRSRAGNLTAALVAVAFLELLLNRLANRLFLPRSAFAADPAGSPAARLLSESGPFLSHLTGVLGLLILLVSLAGLLRRGELFPRPMRFTVGLIGFVFWLLGAWAITFGMVPSRFFLILETSFGFSSLFIASALLGSGTQRRVKVGVALMSLPGVLHVLAVVGDSRGWGFGSDGSLLMTRLGELTLLAACLASPVLLSPRPLAERPWRRPLCVSAFLTSLLVVALASRYDLLQAALLYGLRLELPRLGSPLGVAYVLAFAAWSYATTQLLVDKGGMRLAGYGLLLLAIAGYQASSPVELTLSLLGLLALSVGELRAAPYGDRHRPRLASGPWRTFIGELATAAGDGTDPDGAPSEAVVVEEGEQEVSRIRAYRRGYPVHMRLLRRRGTLVELEATVGLPPHGGPDASIERHRNWLARSPEQRVRLPRAKTGDAPFDQRFSVHGHAPLQDADVRRRVTRALADGLISLWCGAAARFHLTAAGPIDEAPAMFRGQLAGTLNVEGVVGVLETLADLVEAQESQATPPAPS
jgi:hypothetical protein